MSKKNVQHFTENAAFEKPENANLISYLQRFVYCVCDQFTKWQQTLVNTVLMPRLFDLFYEGIESLSALEPILKEYTVLISFEILSFLSCSFSPFFSHPPFLWTLNAK